MNFPKSILLLPAIGAVCFFSSLYLYGRLGPAIPISVNSVQTTKTDLYTVSGEGKASAPPNLAVINLGVQTQDITVKNAQAKADQIVNKTSADLNDLGVESKDITTTNYSIFPNYNFANGQQTSNGYNVNITLSVKIRDLNKVNDAIDRATADGANSVSGLTFTVDDNLRQKLEDEARKQAVIQAKQKAEDLAAVAGITLGRIVDVQENTSVPRPQPLTMAAPGTGGANETSTNVQPGTAEVSLTVSLSYEIR